MNISKSENLQIVHFITRPTIFVVILEYIENGLIVGEILLITIKSEQKMFWTAFKRITNKKKLTNIPPIFDNDTYITNFQQKAKIFNDYFADQCKNYDNGSILPEFISTTESSISHVDVHIETIVAIIQKYSVNKVQFCDEISVAMLKLCAAEVAIPLRLIFQRRLSTGTFPDSWKCANVQPIHKT